MKAIKKIALLLIALLVITPVVPAQAGTIEKDSSLLVDGQLNSTDWFDAEDSTYVEDGKLILPADSYGNTRIISKIIAQEDTAYQTMFTLTAKIQLSQLAENEKFIFAMGLDSIEAFSGEAGNIEIEITNNGQLQLGVVSYSEGGVANTVASAKNIGIRLDQEFTLLVTATTDHNLTISVDGAVVCEVSIAEDLQGRIGFLQTGNCSAEIIACDANFTQYERPENPNISEDFETDIFNDNWFTTNFISSVRYPAYVAVEELDGNSVLMYHNAKLTYFGTKHAYSNFELTFDVPYYLRNMVKDDNGNMTAAPTMEFLVSLGDDAVDFNGFGYATSTEAIRFTKDTVHGLNHSPEKFRAEYASRGYFDPTTNEGFSVLVRMIDGHLEVGIKALDAEKFDILAQADYEDFRTGYIKIWSVNDANFAIDNCRLTNLDKDANLIDTGFEGATIIQEDFDYQPVEPVFRPVDQTETEEPTNWLPVIITGSVCAVAVVISIVIALCMKKKRKQKEGIQNEIQ